MPRANRHFVPDAAGIFQSFKPFNRFAPLLPQPFQAFHRCALFQSFKPSDGQTMMLQIP
jgi:hypothetical protein